MWRVALDVEQHLIASPSTQKILGGDAGAALRIPSAIWTTEVTERMALVDITEAQLLKIGSEWYNGRHEAG